MSEDEASVPYVAHDEFRNGAAHGRFRIVVDPALARPYVVRRTRIDLLAVLLIVAGAALALAGKGVPGVVLVALGVIANRLVRHQAGKIVLQLALKDPQVYAEVTSNGVMEVRRAA
jgi:hypothetical protein